MALRRPGRLVIDDWRGLDSFTHVHDLKPDQWFECDNVIVNATSSAEPLRSPKAFGTAITGYDDSDTSSVDGPSSSSSSSEHDPTVDLGPILSMDEFRREAGSILFVDRGGDTYTYAPDATRTPRRSDQAGDPWTSVNVANTFQRIDGNEFIQYLSSLVAYRNGIDPPAAAPTISYTTDNVGDSISDDCTVEISLQVSYAYKNSTTGHIGEASPISNVLGPTTTDHTLRVPVVASTQFGVDKIVFFITLDGGSIPYLALECGTDTVYEVNNTTANVDIPLCGYDVDTFTPETIYNVPPPTDGTYMFGWKDRLVVLRGRFVQYSAWEVAYAGRPYECWPTLNQLAISGREDICVSGIATALGALIFGKEDTYIISGYPSDKVSSPNNTLAVTEHMEPMKWGLGCYEQGAKTVVRTPFGILWLDQAKKLRLWTLKEFPQEVGIGFREELGAMTGEITATWHPLAKNTGMYVIRNASKVLIITAFQDSDGQLRFGFGKSTQETEAISTFKLSSGTAFIFGSDAQLYQWLNPDLRGDGWDSTTEIFFKSKIGNEGNFTYFHSVSIEGSGINSSLTFKVNDEVIPIESDIDTDSTYYGLVDQEGRRHTMEFRWNRDDAVYRAIDLMQIFENKKKRII